MSFPRYPHYKPSGVEWLGEVPEHWELCLLKRSFSAIDYGISDSLESEGEVAVLRMGNIVNGKIVTNDLKYIYSVDDALLLKDNDLLFNRTNSLELIGKVGLFAGNHCQRTTFASYLVRLRTKASCLPQYYAYLLNTEGILGVARASAFVSIGQCNLNPTRYGLITVAVPPQVEQSSIATFLDDETAKIDALVAEQQRLIELLKEKRQAVISHAVTKGLDPTVPMKPSGIEWLGEVPEHWTIAPILYRYSVQLGKMLDASRITGRSLHSYLRVADVQWGAINLSELPQMDFSEDDRERFSLVAGDLLVNEGGSYPGRSAIWSGAIEECYYQKALHRMRAHRPEQDSTRFLFYLMYWAAHQGVFIAGGNETTIEHLPAERLRKYRFPFPLINEQLEIATFLDTETTKYDTLTAEAERAIELLQERRTALISAAVTGQIDVRQLAQGVAA